jgi:hypothetical protein
MTFATRKCDYLKTKGTWGGKSLGDKNIVSMSAVLNALKGHLKLNDKVRDVIKGKGKGKEKRRGGNRKMKNKKNTGNKDKQEEDKAWKNVPPKSRDKKSKEVGKYTYHWYEHHMAWCMHKPSECCLGKERKEEQSQPILQTLPPMQPPLLQWSTPTSRLSLPPLAQLCRGRTKKNDGASQHTYGHIC